MSSNSSSRARPIHQLYRDVRSTPDEAEPSYSFEQESFLAQREDELDDAFHRRNNYNRRDSTSSQGSTNRQQQQQQIQHHHQQQQQQHRQEMAHNRIIDRDSGTNVKDSKERAVDPISEEAAVAGTNGSFWRMEALKNNQSNPTMKSAVMVESSPLQAVSRSKPSFGSSGMANGSSEGGGLAAALNAASSAASTASSDSHHNSSLPRRGSSSSSLSRAKGSPPPPTPRRNMPFSKKKKGKDISKQRSAERRNKLESQSEQDLGHLMSNSNSSHSHHTYHQGSVSEVSAAASAAANLSAEQSIPPAAEAHRAATTGGDTELQFQNDAQHRNQSPKRGYSEGDTPSPQPTPAAASADTSTTHHVPPLVATSSGDVDASAPFGWSGDTSVAFSLGEESNATSSTTGTNALAQGNADAKSVSSRTEASAAAAGSSLLFGKPSNGSVLLGKSSSLIFPTGVEPTATAGRGNSIGSVGRGSSNASSSDYAANNLKRRKVNLLLDQCETVRFPFKKKLILNDLGLSAADIPVKDLCGTPLGQSLHKLSLAGNRLGYVPSKLVTNLPLLKHLDLSQCELHHLPETWFLPNLRRLNLSHNRLTDFPEESMLEGLPELQELNMYGNKVAEIIIPHSNGTKKQVLSKLETLNLGYNDLSSLPEDLNLLKGLRTLKVMNNFLERVPVQVCDMDLRMIDVSSNPVIQPPIETCERGISSMKRYYHCLRMEATEAAASGPTTNSGSKSSSYYEDFTKFGKKTKKKVSYGLLKAAPKLLKPGVAQRSPSTPQQQPQHLQAATRQASDEASLSQASVSTAPSALVQSQSTNLASSTASSPVRSDGGKVREPRSKSDGEHPRDAVLSTPVRGKKATSPVRGPASAFSLADSTDDISKDGGGPSYHEVETQPQHMQGYEPTPESITVNDTLKVIFVGMAMVGKTSMIKRLIEGENAIIPSHDDRTVGVDIYEWDNRKDKRFEHIDSRVQFEDKELESAICKAAGTEEPNVNVKFSVWDFAGQHVYHATHQLFFSPRALYVLVWDMGATNRGTLRRMDSRADERGAFKLSYDSSDEEDSDEEEDELDFETEARRADRALDRDIDEKVQFWVDCIQSSAPGAAILPVASFNDHFSDSEGGIEEAKRRCRVMKERLLRHEERRIEGIKERLKEYHDSNRANDEGAVRLQKLLDSYTRPKLILGDDDDPVVRVSGSMYTGFDVLTKKIVDIATGRYKGHWQHPIFRGHIGVRIPRMRLQVRDVVRSLRNQFKVVEWGYFLNQLRDRGLTNVEDISDALHFLTNVGELSYFGAVFNDRQSRISASRKERDRRALRAYNRSISDDEFDEDDDDDDDEFDDEYDEGGALLSIDDTTMSASAQLTEDSSLTGSTSDWNMKGLSQYVFLNPRWLVAAVACILRHDLDREIQETRRSLSAEEKNVNFAVNFYDAHLNCPVITSRDAKMLWQAKKITRKAADRALKSSSSMTVTPFEFLLLLLIRFGVFVPIDLSIEKALLGGKDYAGQQDDNESESFPTEVSFSDTTTTAATTTAGDSPLKARFFFLPSLLGPGEPAEAWTYKNSESWKTTLAHSVLFPDGVPPGLMERITASVLSNIYAVAQRTQQSPNPKGRLSVKEVLCWRTAFYLKLGTQSSDTKESIVEIFTHLVDRDSNLCVGSDYMGIGMRRLITSAKGQVGDRGRKIWEGGYLLVVQSVRQVMEEYGGLEFERQAFCTECLAKNSLSRTSAWDFTVIRSAVLNGDGTIRCRDGHQVFTSLIAGPSHEPKRVDRIDKQEDVDQAAGGDNGVPVKDLLRGVVVVGLFDGKTRKVVRVGSGFVVDRKRGLIVTASHTLMNIWGDKNTPFGENYYGLRQGKVVIGVIPRQKESASNADSTMALFRYFAQIVAKDPSIEKGECHLDACVLQITTRMENDVGGDGDDCGDQPERLLLNNPEALKKEKLQPLKITEKVELDEQVRILGYNQGGEGLLGPGQSLNRYVDFARGYVCKMFSGDMSEEEYQRHRFKPRKEIVVICPTIGGHSGGPCVNQQGEVIGILSRADPAESQRCYLVPTAEWKSLVKQAKNKSLL